MVNLDGMVCAGELLENWHRGNIGASVPLAALIFLLLGMPIVMCMRIVRASNTVPWTKLPADGEEDFEKQPTPADCIKTMICENSLVLEVSQLGISQSGSLALYQ